jgi:hypothetical protein
MITCILKACDVIGQAPEQQAQAHVTPKLAHAEKGSEGPVADHAHQPIYTAW